MGATAGIAAPVLAFACILLAVASYHGFSWTNNALSDLGIIPGITGPLFNFGLYASGFLAIIFAVFGLFSYLEKGLIGKVGAIVFAGTAFALICIGIFNESFSGLHYDFSVTFFVLVPISMFIITCAFALEHRGKMALFTVLIGVAAALPWILQFSFNYVPNVAIPESVSGLAISTWAITVSCKMLGGN
jgi:hypothetical membrane protein